MKREVMAFGVVFRHFHTFSPHLILELLAFHYGLVDSAKRIRASTYSRNKPSIFSRADSGHL
jgi:hypothetical protein